MDDDIDLVVSSPFFTFTDKLLLNDRIRYKFINKIYLNFNFMKSFHIYRIIGAADTWIFDAHGCG